MTLATAEAMVSGLDGGCTAMFAAPSMTCSQLYYDQTTNQLWTTQFGRCTKTCLGVEVWDAPCDTGSLVGADTTPPL